MHSNKRAKHENFYEGEGGQTLKAFRKWTKAMEWVDFLIQHVNDIWNETQRGLFPARKHRSEAFVALCLMAISNKTAGRISKILYQCPAGFMFTHPPLWISWQCLFKGLLMLDCICQTKLFFQIYILYTDGLLLIKHDRHYIILHQLDQGLHSFNSDLLRKSVKVIYAKHWSFLLVWFLLMLTTECSKGAPTCKRTVTAVNKPVKAFLSSNRLFRQQPTHPFIFRAKHYIQRKDKWWVLFSTHK